MCALAHIITTFKYLLLIICEKLQVVQSSVVRYGCILEVKVE